MERAYRIHINGIVQGVGFRPFVYRLARELNIKGWINNTSDGVEIHAEGEKTEIFWQRILDEKPPLAFILSQEKTEVPREDFLDFRIVESSKTDKNDTLIAPDVATCKDCLQEMFAPKDRRYHYPFINCTNCGPRYTIIYDRPYDRPLTTMKAFQMCSSCRKEYEDPRNRRFHAQPIACDVCGPALKLTDAEGRELKGKGIGLSFLAEGAILAVKGLGGFHLVCDATNEAAIRRLRKLKERGAKPFALMAKSIEAAAKEVKISEQEKKVLTSPAAPIVLLVRQNQLKSKIPSEVAPGLHTLGIMLPYTPIHHLLFTGDFEFLVMTSANLSGQPLIFENETALRELKGIADYFLLHNRDIYHPCDDSVVQFVGEQMTFIRRARGYVPLPIVLKEEFQVPIAGLGGEMKNAFCLAMGNMAFMSQYIGDMHGLENFERFNQEYSSYQRVVNIFPQKVAHDLHPEYTTTKMAKSMACPQHAVQHHHAHLVSVCGEHRLCRPILGLICDGTGYGQDGKIWGFEFLYGDAGGAERRAHLEYLPLPGGDAGAKHPLRIAYAYLQKTLSAEEWHSAQFLRERLSSEERVILDGQLKSGLQIYETSSAGRLFDAVSGLLGVCTEVTYEGQAAIELESTATVWLQKHLAREEGLINCAKQTVGDYDVCNSDHVVCNNHPETDVKSSIVSELENAVLSRLSRTQELLEGELLRDCKQARLELIERYNEIVRSSPAELYPIWLETQEGKVTLKIDLLLKKIVQDYLNRKTRGEIACRFHFSLAISMLETALLLGLENNEMVIGGGVFQNKLLTETLLALAQRIGVKIYYPLRLPAGDGGLALGQVLVAKRSGRAI
ncbi:MAG: carbamoyltransferase HypF [Desulfitobacteriia bacterium]